MKEPQEPSPPWEMDYRASVEHEFIYYSLLRTLSSSLKVSFQDIDDDEPTEQEKKIAKLPRKKPANVTLAWLLTLVPEGVKPEDIKIDFGYNASFMSYEDHYVGFYYDVKIPAKTKELKAAKEKYKLDLAQYEKDLVAYNEWKRNDEIRQTENKLKALKNGK
jgi:hypothetical protein